jgi:hypothetical protein
MARKRRTIPDDGWTPGEVTFLSSSAKSPAKMGRPREIEWPRIYAEIAWRVVHEKPPRVRTQFRDKMLEWCGDEDIKEPAPSAMLDAVNAICERFNYGRRA